MRVIGLTGSIGMGKTTTAAMFRRRGVPVHDADAAVHRLYQGRAVQPIEAAFPGVTENGAVSRIRLSSRVVGNSAALARLEAIVHPLVAEEEAKFLKRAGASGHALVVLDIPLLFEAGGVQRVDTILVVTAVPEVQRARVLARAGMTAEKLERILARQMPDHEKRRRAHFVIDSGRGIPAAERAVGAMLRSLAAG